VFAVFTFDTINVLRFTFLGSSAMGVLVPVSHDLLSITKPVRDTILTVVFTPEFGLGKCEACILDFFAPICPEIEGIVSRLDFNIHEVVVLPQQHDNQES
jgi:hypothetical protein